MVFVGYSESLASARAMALKHRYEIDPDQELIAQGMACGAAGFVGGFATDGSLSKTSVADAAGQKTQMASLVNAVFVLLTMLFLASLFENLPAATLGAVVIDAMLGVVTSGPCGAISGEPRRLGVLHRGDARHPVLRHHPGDPDRGGAVAAAADRPGVQAGGSPAGPGSEGSCLR